jgi:hypothetical protein
MKLNHLDLQTTDVQALAAFFVDHFDLTRRTNDRSLAIAILGDEAGFTLVIQRHAAPVYPEHFHIGFIHDRVEPVRAHRDRLVAAGVGVGELSTDNRGSRFYLKAPGDLLVEVSTPARG